MHAKIRSLFILTAVLALTLATFLPARADDEPPPDETADIATLRRVWDLSPGPLSSYPSDMVVIAGNLYFAADSNNGYGREIWILGIPTGIDVYPGAGSSSPTSLTVHNGAIYFSADGGDGTGKELWRFEWTNGAQRVTDLAPGITSSLPAGLVVYDGNLYFSANSNNGYGRELWMLGDPNAIDINTGSGSSSPAYMTVYNNAIYFGADGGDGAGQELWSFDTTNGARRVVDINPGVLGSYPLYLAVYDGALYFRADGADEAGGELWMYDPINGAQRVADISIGLPSSDPNYLTVYNGALYFGAFGYDNAGQELWKYDPTNGADLVADIHPGPGSSFPAYLTVFNGALYFRADGNDGTGAELWMYDNTATAKFRPAKSLDGWVLESGENTNAGGLFNANLTTFNLGDDPQDKQYRSILSFNTTSLPDNAVIISATLRIRKQGMVGTDPFTTHGNILVDIIKGAFSNNNALQAGDFQAAPGRANAGIIKNLPDGNQWFTTALSKLAYPHINKTGVTQLRLRFTKDDNNDNGADFLRFFSADLANISDYPVLEVKYYIP